MPIRRSYHFNTVRADKKDGIYLNDPCDLHFRKLSNYAEAPYGVDVDGNNVLGLGDRTGYKTNSGSLPVQIIGGMHYHHDTVAVNTVVNNDHNVIYANTTGGNVTITLPLLANELTDDRIIFIHKLERANTIIITPSGTDTVEGLTGTQYTVSNPDYGFSLIGDKAAGCWRRIENSSLPMWLSQEVPCSSNVTINSSTWTTIRSIVNVPFSKRDYIVFLSGSGWYNSTEIAYMEFSLFVNGVYQSPFCRWYNMQSQHHIPFSGSLVYAATASGLYTVEVRGRRVAGGNNFTMDNNDFISFNMLKC